MTLTSDNNFVFRQEPTRMVATCIHCFHAKEVGSASTAWCSCGKGDAVARLQVASRYQLRMVIAALVGSLEDLTGGSQADILAEAWTAVAESGVLR